MSSLKQFQFLIGLGAGLLIVLLIGGGLWAVGVFDQPTPVPTLTASPQAAARQVTATPPLTITVIVVATAEPTDTPIPTSTPRPTAYVVQAGDTLEGIALKFGVSVDALMVVNGLSDELIYEGQTLKLPAVSTPAGATATLRPTPEAGAPSPSATPAPDAPDAEPTPPVLVGEWPHYRMDIALDYAAHYLEADVKITLVNATADTWEKVVFSVPPAHRPANFDLSAVEIIGDDASLPAVHELDNTMLHVSLPDPLPPGADVTVRIAFGVQLAQLDPRGWPPVGNLGWGPGVIQAGDWHPTLVPYNNSQGWVTWEYHPVGDPTIYELGTYDVWLTTDPEIVVAGAGQRSRDGGTWHFQLDKARAFAFLASPDYQVISDVVAGIPVRCYYLPGYDAGGQAVIDTAAQAVPYFANLYGPYPYSELVIAQNGYLGAMEYSALVTQGTFAFDTYTGDAESLLVALTAHEISHQWWYGAVGNDQVHESWLDESLAMFSELLFYENFYPEHIEWWWWFRVDRWEPEGWVDVEIYDYEDSPTFVHMMYGMSSHFLNDLRATVGEAAFIAFLQDYFASQRDHIASSDDFFAALRRHTDADLTPLLERYFREPDR